VISPHPEPIVTRALESALLRHWPRYRSVRATTAQVTIENLRTPIPKVEAGRLSAAADLVDLFVAESVPTFVTASVNGRLVVAPIVERHRIDLVLIDGLHRALALRRAGASVMSAVMVEAAEMPPPVAPVRGLDEVEIVEGPILEAPFFAGRGFADFRPSDLFVATATESLAQKRT
jgi:hypothetical protein